MANSKAAFLPSSSVDASPNVGASATFAIVPPMQVRTASLKYKYKVDVVRTLGVSENRSRCKVRVIIERVVHPHTAAQAIFFSIFFLFFLRSTPGIISH